MRTFERVCEAIGADADGIAQSQAPAGAGDLTLNGASVVLQDGSQPANLGAAVLDPPRPVLIASDGDESGLTLTVYGYDRANRLISEVVTGPNATVTATQLHFAVVTRIAISGAAAGNVTSGWDDTSYSPWMPLGNSCGPAGFRLVTVGNDLEGASIFFEAVSKNILREGNMEGDYPGAGEIQTIDDAGSPFAGDVETVCLVPYAAIRLVCNGNSVPIKFRVNPNYTA